MIGLNPTTGTGVRLDRPEEKSRRMAPTGASIGALLRERREALGASLAEVEAATKIRQKYLSALEADEWQQLPGEVVGRGFLRNYASYLGLEPTDIIDRRRAIADPSLAGALAATSAGSELPPPRAVDYRPKDVDLREEPESLEERTPPRLGPLLAAVGAIAVLLLFWWGLTRFGGALLDGVTSTASNIGDRVSGIFSGDGDTTPTPNSSLAVLTTPGVAPTSTSVFEAIPTLNTALGMTDTTASNTGGVQSAPAEGAVQIPTSTPAGVQEAVPTSTPTLAPTVAPTTPAAQQVSVTTQANLRSLPSLDGTVVGAANVGDLLNATGQSADGEWLLLDNGAWLYAELVSTRPANLAVVDPATVTSAGLLLPTATPATEDGGFALPTATPAGENAAEVLPEETPTEAPTPEPEPVVVAAACADAGTQITSPGVNQVVSGAVQIVGTATNAIFQSYKIEAGQEGALNFMASGNNPVEGGVLGSVNTTNFPNGSLLIRLTVVDQTGNFPAPCDVVVTVQN